MKIGKNHVINEDEILSASKEISTIVDHATFALRVQYRKEFREDLFFADELDIDCFLFDFDKYLNKRNS
jgi:hypothetical protein